MGRPASHPSPPPRRPMRRLLATLLLLLCAPAMANAQELLTGQTFTVPVATPFLEALGFENYGIGNSPDAIFQIALMSDPFTLVGPVYSHAWPVSGQQFGVSVTPQILLSPGAIYFAFVRNAIVFTSGQTATDLVPDGSAAQCRYNKCEVRSFDLTGAFVRFSEAPEDAVLAEPTSIEPEVPVVAPVPEPSTVVLMASGLLAVGVVVRRRRSRSH